MMKLPYSKEQFLEYCAGNPNSAAKKIISAGADDVSTYNLIAECRNYMFTLGSFESLKCFNEELVRLGWGKEEEKK